MHSTMIASPRLQCLAEELRTGNTAARNAFWEEVKRDGAPLVEAVEGSHDQVYITFLWQADEETEQASVCRTREPQLSL